MRISDLEPGVLYDFDSDTHFLFYRWIDLSLLEGEVLPESVQMPESIHYCAHYPQLNRTLDIKSWFFDHEVESWSLVLG